MARILVVDNEADNLFLCRRYLEKKGHEVTEALSGEECLQKLKTEQPDLILLDIMMPGMDGWEVLQEMKKDPSTSSIPVAMLTVLHLSEEIIQSRNIEGLVDYIFKPFRPEVLSQKVSKILKTVSEIREKKKRILEIDPEIGEEYEDVSLSLLLHENIRETLERILQEKRSSGQIRDIHGYEAYLEKEKGEIQKYAGRKAEIEKLLQ
jgi:CheY-like chemotaxis protein